MRIRFHGAARTVTGSLHIVETARGEIILLDCGLFQGRRAEALQRNATFPVDPAKVAAIVLSHAHIDHIGNLPSWAKRGLRCPIYATGATADLTALMLRDSARIQVSDVMHVNKHLRNGERPVEPLYTPDDAEAAIRLLRGRNYKQWFPVLPGIRAMYHDAGHIFGSASILLEENLHGTTKQLIFTGDLGRPDSPILRDAEPFSPGAGVLLTESTYGDREHPPQADLPGQLETVLKSTFARGGKVLIPAFALGRTQTLMYVLRDLQRAGKLPNVPVYVDSPLANGTSEVYKRHPECYDEEADTVLDEDGALFALDHFTAISSAEDSKALNGRREPSVIIASSGMCEAGRILHHLDHNLEDARTTVLIVGFQAENTLGRRLVEGMKMVKVFGREKQVHAEIKVLNGFSAHAGRSELLAYLERCRPNGPVFLVHGDEPRTASFKEFLQSKGFPDVRVPAQGEIYNV